MVAEIIIDERRIGPDHPPYIVAELSANHGGRFEKAIATMEAAHAAGASAVKLQTYTPDTMTIDHDSADFLVRGGLWDGRRLYELYREAHTPWDWHEPLFARGRQLGITVFSTPFDETAVELLERVGAPAYKIASFELLDQTLIRTVAYTKKPVLISTGMASSEEIAEAVEVFRVAGGRDLLLFHCVSGYPTPAGEANLRRIPALATAYNCPIGLSDHSLGIDIALAGVALGACAVEKHFTLTRQDHGPDSDFSIEPDELADLVKGAQRAFAALGSGRSQRSPSEEVNRSFRRSLYVVADIGAGEKFTQANVRAIRPGFGLAPKHLSQILGLRAQCAVKRGTPMSFDLVDGLKSKYK
jgi:N-acetylneuraminate synthase